MLADECTDISTIEELSIVCRWVEDGLPVEHFIEMVPLKRADANTIYETLIECLKKKGVMISNMIRMGFDGAPTFSWQHNRLQALLKGIHLTQFLYTATAIYYNLCSSR